jgi:type IV pilus assembly protein PilE
MSKTALVGARQSGTTAVRIRKPMNNSTIIAGRLPANGINGKVKGFTMIELLIVIAIVGIIAAISYPSYGDYVKRTRRADGHMALLAATQTMERCKSLQYSYANCTLSQSESAQEYYALALDPAPTATTFTVVATAQDVQAHDSDCVTLTLDHLGVQGFTGAGSECWK